MNPEVPSADLRARVIEALKTAHEPAAADEPSAVTWARRHGDGHNFHSLCYLCTGDIERVADAVLRVLVVAGGPDA